MLRLKRRKESAIPSPANYELPLIIRQVSSDDDDDDILADEDVVYLRRLDGGLFTLQTADYLLAWVVMEDDGVSQAVLSP